MAFLIRIKVDDNPLREKVLFRESQVPLFRHRDTIRGQVTISPLVRPPVANGFAYVKILKKVQTSETKSASATELFYRIQQKVLVVPGLITSTTTFPFEFLHVVLEDDTFHGRSVRVSYIVRVEIMRNERVSAVEEYEFLVGNTTINHEGNNRPIRLRHSLGDFSYIEARFEKNFYHMNEVLNGRVSFLLWEDTRVESVGIELQRKVFVKLPNTGYKLLEVKLVDACVVNIFQSRSCYGEDRTIDIALVNDGLTPTQSQLVLGQFKVEYYLKLIVAMKKETEVMDVSEPEEICVVEESSDSDKLEDRYVEYDSSDSTASPVESVTGSPVLVTRSRIVKFYRVAI